MFTDSLIGIQLEQYALCLFLLNPQSSTNIASVIMRQRITIYERHHAARDAIGIGLAATSARFRGNGDGYSIGNGGGCKVPIPLRLQRGQSGLYIHNLLGELEDFFGIGGTHYASVPLNYPIVKTIKVGFENS